MKYLNTQILNLDTEVTSLDFSKTKWKLTHIEDGIGWLPQCEMAERRLYVSEQYHSENSSIPTKLVDEAGHVYILDRQNCYPDLRTFLGKDRLCRLFGFVKIIINLYFML